MKINFINNVIIKSISSVISLGINLSLIIFLTNILSDFDFGLFNYLLTIGNLLIFFLCAGFSSSFINYYALKKKKEILTTYIIINLILILFFFLISNIFLIFENTYHLIFNDKINLLIINLGLFTGLITYLFEKVGEIYDAQNKSRTFDVLKICIRVSILIIILIFYYIDIINLTYIFASIILINFIFIIFLINQIQHYINFKIRGKFLSVFNVLTKNYFLFYPMMSLSAIYQILFRVVLNKDVGMIEQGIFGLAFYIFTASILPFSSLSNLLLAYASSRKIFFTKDNREIFFLIINKILFPLALLCASLITILYEPLISTTTSKYFLISNTALWCMFLWCITSTYYNFLFSTVVSSNEWGILIWIRPLVFIILITILLVIYLNEFNLNLNFYFIFLILGMVFRFTYIFLLALQKNGIDIFYKIKYSILFLILSVFNIYLYFNFMNLYLSIFIFTCLSIIWFFNSVIEYKNLNHND